MNMNAALEAFIESCLKERVKNLEKQYKGASPEHIVELQDKIAELKKKHEDEIASIKDDHYDHIEEIKDKYLNEIESLKEKIYILKEDMQALSSIFTKYRTKHTTKKGVKK